MPNIKMPSMTRAVITGRRIKISATLMGLLAFGSRRGGFRSAGCRSCRLFKLDLGDSRHQPQLSVGYYLFARGQPLRDDGLSVAAAIEGNWARLDRHVRLDHKNELPGLAILNCLRRHHNRFGLLS